MNLPARPTPTPAAGAALVLPTEPPPLAQVEQLVHASARIHGHLCPGQVIGVRMSILGLSLLGYGCPLGMPEIKNIIGFVEIERCLADAVAVASGLRFGRGSLRLINQGLLAATFLDTLSGRAVRLVSREEPRQTALEMYPNESNPHTAQVLAYRVMPDAELFDAQWVSVALPPDQMPGVRPPKVPCMNCGVLIRSGQVHRVDGRDLCAPCAGRAYFLPVAPPTKE